MKTNNERLETNWDEVLRDPRAKNALEVFARKGASSNLLRQMVESAAKSQTLPRSFDIYAVDGMTRKQVADFPKTLRVIADQIQRIRENPHLCPKSAANQLVGDLPATLREYADTLSKSIQFGREFMKKNPRYFDLASIFKLKLLEYVQQTTGTPHYSLVADLLQAAITSTGLEVDETYVDANALRKLYLRQSEHQILAPIRNH